MTKILQDKHTTDGAAHALVGLFTLLVVGARVASFDDPTNRLNSEEMKDVRDYMDYLKGWWNQK